MFRAPTVSVRREAPTISAAPATAPVHESEVQRQHPRVKLPGFIEFSLSREQRGRFRLFDVSAGGFCFETPGALPRVGESFRGNLIVTVDTLSFALAVSFQVRSSGHGRVGCSFRDLGPREISTIRHLLTSFISGEIIGVGDVLQTLARDNFTKPRPARAPELIQQNNGRSRALLLTLLIFAGGAVACAYAAKQLHQALFVATASSAKVAGPVHTILMPREGTFRSLIPEDGLLKKGAPVASIESPVLDLVRGQVASANLSPEQVDRMLKQTVKGTITSPCDCRLQSQLVADAQFVNRGQPLFELVPRTFDSFIIARFPYDQLRRLSPGTAVQFRVSGDGALRYGTISEVRVPGEGDSLQTDVLATIEPAEPLPQDIVQRPVQVSAGGLGALPEHLFAAIQHVYAGGDPE